MKNRSFLTVLILAILFLIVFYSYSYFTGISKIKAKEYEKQALYLNNIKEYTLALEVSEKCLEIDQENFDCWIHRAMAQYQLDKCIQAAASLYHSILMNNISNSDKEFAIKSFDAVVKSEKCKSDEMASK